VETGIWRALAGAVEAMRSRLAHETGVVPLTVLSGGEAAGLAAVLAGPIQVVEDLVLEGLLWIARGSDAPGRSR
jgi:type III pantothenate kinase